MSDWFTQNLSTPNGSTPPPPAQPASPAPAAAGNWFSQNLNGQPAGQPAVQPAASTPAPTAEGTYAMQLNGQTQQIPYSKVPQAKLQGYTFAGDTQINPWYFVPGSSKGKNLRQTKAEAQYNSDVQDDLSKRIAREVLASPGGREMVEGDGLDLALGAAREVARDAIGVKDIAMGKPKPTGEGQQPKKSALREFAEEGNQGFGENMGAALETTEEFMAGEGLMKGLTKLLGYAPKLAEAARIEQEIKKGSAMGQLFKQALMQATIGGGQEFVKSGGDVGQAAETGALTGALSFGVGAASRKLGAGIRNATPGTETIGGQEFETPAPKDLPQPTPNQAAGQATIRQSAQDVAQSHLEELNQSRETPANPPALPARTGPFEFRLKGATLPPETEGALTTPAEKIPRSHTSLPADRTGATEYSRIGTEPEYIRPGDTFAQRTGRVHVERRIPGYSNPAPGTPGRADVTREFGTMTTQDPNVAKAHLDNLNQTINGPGFDDLHPDRQAELLDAQADAQRQLADYHQQVRTQLPGYGKPQMRPVNVPSAIDSIGSFSDTASTLKNTAAQGYDHITDALGLAGETPQRLTQVRQAYQAAEAKFMAADSPEALSAAERDIEAAHDQLRGMVGKIPNAISLSELSGLNTAYANSLGLEKFARAVDSTFTGTPTSRALRAGEYYGFNGQRLGENIRSFVRTMGRGRADRLIGADRLDTLLRVADLNTTNAGRSKFGLAIEAVKDNLIRMHVGPIAAGGYVGHILGLPWEVGAAAGWATAEGTKKLTQLIVSKPQLAKNVLFALDAGARPEKYGPFIATMIRNLVEQANKEEPNDDGSNQD